MKLITKKGVVVALVCMLYSASVLAVDVVLPDGAILRCETVGVRLTEAADDQVSISILNAMVDVSAFLMEHDNYNTSFSIEHRFFVTTGLCVREFVDCYGFMDHKLQMMHEGGAIDPLVWDGYYAFVQRLVPMGGDDRRLERDFYLHLIPDFIGILFRKLPEGYSSDQFGNQVVQLLIAAYNKVPAAERMSVTRFCRSVAAIGFAAGGNARLNARIFLQGIADELLGGEGVDAAQALAALNGMIARLDAEDAVDLPLVVQ